MLNLAGDKKLHVQTWPGHGDCGNYGMADLLQELHSLPLLLFPESLSPFSLLEALTERVVVIVVDLQQAGTESQTNS